VFTGKLVPAVLFHDLELSPA